ncbi:MAG: hypothetical protein H6Q67_762 [Firmicutes bacterium]|nr:hypothetical protein [Bacillota bacterium]
MTATNSNRDTITNLVEGNFYRKAIDQARDIILLVDTSGKILHANRSATKAYGYTQEELCNMQVLDLRADETRTFLSDQIKSAYQVQKGVLYRTIHVRRSGKYFPVEVSSACVHIENRDILVNIIRDITKIVSVEEALKKAGTRYRQLNEELTAINEELIAADEELRSQFEELGIARDALEKSEERYKLALEAANAGVWDCNLLTGKMQFSDKAIEIMGVPINSFMTPEDVDLLTIFPEDLPKVLKRRQEQLIGSDIYFACEYRIMTPRGIKWVVSHSKIVRDNVGRPIRVVGTLRDITENKQYEEKINYLAYTDSITGLANRTAWDNRIQSVIGGCENENSSGAVLYIDIDNFKNVNDSYGHTFGDKLLVYIGQLLNSFFPEFCFVARMGGDEFAILLDKPSDRSEVTKCVNNILKLFAKPLNIEERLIYITVSIGIVIFPQNGTTPDEVLTHADLAMYRAKTHGKNRYMFFDRKIDAVTTKRMRMEQSLRDAINNNELRLYYQPKISVQTNAVTGFEALVRWDSKEFGMVMPTDFISIAEESGIIVSIGRWVQETACNFLSKLRSEGYLDLCISVNVSVVELAQNDFIETVENILAITSLPPECLCLEITESVLMESHVTTSKKLLYLKQLGVKIYLDDFGTGYSSLKYLKDLPLDYIKIDKSFIADITDVENSNDLTPSILELARRSGLKTIAEGVETEYQYNKLHSYGCDLVQGYLFSAPVPEDKAVELLRINQQMLNC